MFPLLILVVDSRIVYRYLLSFFGVDMSLSLVSFFSRQTAEEEEEKKEKCNRSKLSNASRCCFVCLYQRTTKRKEREKNSSSSSFACCTSNNGRYSWRRILVLFLRLLAIQKWNEERQREKKNVVNGQKVIQLIFFIDNNQYSCLQELPFLFSSIYVDCHINH